MAALRDDTKLVLYVGASAKPDILLFSAAGAPLGRVLWEGRARVLAAGWTSGEQLLVVDDAAQVRWVGGGGACLAAMGLLSVHRVASQCCWAGGQCDTAIDAPWGAHTLPLHLCCRCTCSACAGSGCRTASPWGQRWRRREWRQRRCSETAWRC